MARPIRYDFPGAWHHVMSRGARSAPIFLDDGDCLLFYVTVDEAVSRFDLEVHAYALIPNHYHLLVRTPRGNLSAAMRHLNGVYTQRFNRKHEVDGAVFRGRFKSQWVHDETYLRWVLAYIHLNPVRAGLVPYPEHECWTSHRAYLGLEPPTAWLSTGAMTRRFGSAEVLREFVTAVHQHGRQWPDGFDADSGRLTGEQPEVPEEPATAVSLDALPAEVVLDRVAELSRQPRDSLMIPARGPRANPARRLAAWALHTKGRLSYTEVGVVLDMSKGQVARVMSSVRTGEATAPLVDWIIRW